MRLRSIESDAARTIAAEVLALTPARRSSPSSVLPLTNRSCTIRCAVSATDCSHGRGTSGAEKIVLVNCAYGDEIGFAGSTSSVAQPRSTAASVAIGHRNAMSLADS